MNPLWFAGPLIVGAMTPVVLQMSAQMADRIGDMESASILHIVGTVAGLAGGSWARAAPAFSTCPRSPGGRGWRA